MKKDRKSGIGNRKSEKQLSNADPKTPIPDTRYPIPELNRVRWQCRRGMLELDIALLQFLEAEYAQLPANLQQAFRALLELADPDLWDAICGAEPSADEDIRTVLSMLRRIKSGLS